MFSFRFVIETIRYGSFTIKELVLSLTSLHQTTAPPYFFFFLDFLQHAREYIDFAQYAMKYKDFTQYAREYIDVSQHAREYIDSHSMQGNQ